MGKTREEGDRDEKVGEITFSLQWGRPKLGCNKATTWSHTYKKISKGTERRAELQPPHPPSHLLHLWHTPRGTFSLYLTTSLLMLIAFHRSLHP